MITTRYLRQSFVIGLILFVFGSFCGIALAEDPSGYPHQGSTNVLRAPGIQLCRMLYLRSVRQSVGMKEEDFAELQEKICVLSALLPTIPEFSGGSPSDREAVLETIASEADKLEPEVWSMVSRMIGRDGIDRLMEVYLSYYGLEVILNECIAERLRLSNEQRTKIATAIENLRTERSVILPRLAAGNGSEASKMDELLVLRSSALDHVVRPILNKDQIAFLEPIERIKITNMHRQSLIRYSFGW